MSSILTITPQVLEATFEHLRRCGQGRRECVVAWVGPQERPAHVDEVVHPRHTGSGVAYDIDPAWIGAFWVNLADRHRTVRAQVHTHPGSAYHSERDNTLALVHTAGYLSLVIPRFAAGPVSLDDSYLAARTANGSWCERDPRDTIQVAS